MAAQMPETFYLKLRGPQVINSNELSGNDNQVAGHAGFCSWTKDTATCLKPFNLNCARGKREQLFYQLIQYFEEYSESNLYYKNFPLLSPPILGANCDCLIDMSLFKSLAKFVPKFHNVKQLNESCQSQKFDMISCACYGHNQEEKLACSRDYEKVTFLSLEDLTAHCKKPNIMDIKIGQITYDPMAVKEKVIEQSSKYRQLSEFGFRILGSKTGDSRMDKSLGRKLETRGQVCRVLNDFFEPLETAQRKSFVIQRLLQRLRALINLFKQVNINQLKFFSSSLLIVYDSSDIASEELSQHVRLSMIDFAHVFHVHDSAQSSDGCDSNYLYGLEKLEEFFKSLADRYST